MTSPTDPGENTTRSFASLMELWGRGWEKGDTDWVDEIFSEEAEYVADPFDRPLKGRDAIKRYWADVPKEQAEIDFRFGEVFTVGPWFSTEFRCTFRRRRTGEWLDVRGAVFCETSGGKITEMRMYWLRRRAPSR